MDKALPAASGAAASEAAATGAALAAEAVSRTLTPAPAAAAGRIRCIVPVAVVGQLHMMRLNKVLQIAFSRRRCQLINAFEVSGRDRLALESDAGRGCNITRASGNDRQVKTTRDAACPCRDVYNVCNKLRGLGSGK